MFSFGGRSGSGTFYQPYSKKRGGSTPMWTLGLTNRFVLFGPYDVFGLSQPLRAVFNP